MDDSTKVAKPKDRLEDLELPGDGESPEVFALVREGAGWGLSRRSFIAAATAAALLPGCGKPSYRGRQKREEKEIAYETQDPSTRKWIKHTLPCGSAIPEGGVCTCNCVTVKVYGSPKKKESRFRTKDASGKAVTQTLPCGSPIPAGAFCTCNCVPAFNAAPGPAPRPKPSAATQKKESKVKVKEASGKTVTQTLPCGSPIPAGAICTCNCVPVSTPSSAPSGGFGTTCTCVPVHYWHPN